MSKAIEWWDNLTGKQQLIADELHEASEAFVANTNPEENINSSRRIAFLAGAYLVLKSLGYELPQDSNEAD
jgi:hypothetical protein